MRGALFCAAALLGAATAEPLANGWAPVRAASAAHRVAVALQLRRADPDALDRAFWRVTDPQSPDFRKWLSRDDISALVRPAPGAAEAARRWAAGVSGSARDSPNGDYVIVTAAAGELRKGLGVELWEHIHAESNRTAVRAKASTGVTATSVVPDELRAHVAAVHGATELLPVPRPRSPAADKIPGDDVDPSVIAKQYATSGAAGSSRSPSQGVAGFEQAQFKQSDVDAFQKKYGLPAVKVGVVGPNDGGYFGEASLDTQYITATGRGVPTWFIARDQFDMLAWGFEVMNMSAPPAVLSISWGSGESGYQAAHMQAGSAEFQKLGAAGISVFAASGDAGTGSQGFLGCKKFDPTWPATSPYVTSVGGTYLTGGVEKGWSDSGGGFSAVFTRPSYQDAAVAGYTAAAALPPAGLWSAGGRATPDVSALGTNFKTTSGGAEGLISGTSAATPTYAGLVAVLNAERASRGKPTLGFINPALYASLAGSGKGPGFDVTEGNNKHSGCPAGFPATKGWDAVTGMGTPLLAELRSALSA
eukprot:TRINITY_DN7483_c0_g1_i1.p1 TRINITY_DN7483_c0_g1~~TRINITY_DN7483_c0_g1_i1.p1  ORF type:complete len:559 (+),score=176.86 TRINITY_DN7483_c0_g1_i1:80-1678(+)